MINIFMHCVKHFEYEKKIYAKFLNDKDYLALKLFILKIKNYIDQSFSSSSKIVYKLERKFKNNPH